MSGASEAFVRRLSDVHAPSLYSYVVRRVGDHSLAEDVVQESIVRAWRAHAQYDPSRGSERQWLFGIARNALADKLRNQNRLHLVESPPEDAGADVDLERVVEVSYVAQVLADLSEDHRTAIVEAFYEGRSTREIGERHGIAAGTVKSRIFYGLRAMRNALEEQGVLT